MLDFSRQFNYRKCLSSVKLFKNRRHILKVSLYSKIVAIMQKFKKFKYCAVVAILQDGAHPRWLPNRRQTVCTDSLSYLNLLVNCWWQWVELNDGPQHSARASGSIWVRNRIVYRASLVEMRKIVFYIPPESNASCPASQSLYSHAPHNEVSVNDGLHIRLWSHKIIIL